MQYTSIDIPGITCNYRHVSAPHCSSTLCSANKAYGIYHLAHEPSIQVHKLCSRFLYEISSVITNRNKSMCIKLFYVNLMAATNLWHSPSSSTILWTQSERHSRSLMRSSSNICWMDLFQMKFSQNLMFRTTDSFRSCRRDMSCKPINKRVACINKMHLRACRWKLIQYTATSCEVVTDQRQLFHSGQVA